MAATRYRQQRDSQTVGMSPQPLWYGGSGGYLAVVNLYPLTTTWQELP